MNEKYKTNLNYYENFTSLEESKIDVHERFRKATVLVLGLGGSSTILLALAGMGIGKIIGVDFDVIDTSNLSRQFMYRETDIGKLKTDATVEHISNYNSDTEIDVYKVNLKNVIYESLRLYPPAWTISRQTQVDKYIENIKFDKYSNIIISPWITHRISFPDNPFDYDYTRWDNEDLYKKIKHTPQFLPFGFGKRRCLGEKFALSEMDIIIKSIIKNFNIEYVNKSLEFEYKMSLKLTDQSLLSKIERRT